MEMFIWANTIMEASTAKVYTSGLMAVVTKAILSKVRDMVEESGKEAMEMSLRGSTKMISRMDGEGLHGSMERCTKAISEMTLGMAKALIVTLGER